jgi:hypothetical protein
MSTATISSVLIIQRINQPSIASFKPAWENLPQSLTKWVVNQACVCVFPGAKVTDMEDSQLESIKQDLKKILQDVHQYPHESQKIIPSCLKLYDELQHSQALQIFWLKLLFKRHKTSPLIAENLVDQFFELIEIELRQSRAISRLIRELQHLPNIIKSSHQNYSDALSLTWEYVSKNIQFFKQRPFALEQSLTTWINGYLRWRIKDLYADDKKYRDKFITIDQPPRGNKEYSPLVEVITTKAIVVKTRTESGSHTPPNLDSLDDYIRILQDEYDHKIAQTLEDYVKTDPDRKLQALHPKASPECNCQLLTQRIFFQEPRDRIRNIAKEFSLNEQSLHSHWKKKCLPCLQGLAQEFGYGKEI